MKVKFVIVPAVVALVLIAAANCPAVSSTTQLTCPQHKEAGDANEPTDPNKPADPNKPEDPNEVPIISAGDFTAYADTDEPEGDDANEPNEPNEPNEENKTALCAADAGKDADKPKGDDPNKPCDPNKPADPNDEN
ncbi:MAG: hypothetical protein JW749_07210 [Sedimentisphaerales bacterium]|nr:hypothetical protein [Sedimentisphaerales bacterium]